MELWIKYPIYADDTILMAGTEEELKSLLKVKVKSDKVGLKLNIQKTKIIASWVMLASWDHPAAQLSS